MNNGKLVMCSVYDMKAEAWHNPMFFMSNAQAMRAFGDAVNSDESEFGKHPEDFALFAVGVFDPLTGFVNGEACAEVICKGIDVKEVQS